MWRPGGAFTGMTIDRRANRQREFRGFAASGTAGWYGGYGAAGWYGTAGGACWYGAAGGYVMTWGCQAETEGGA